MDKITYSENYEERFHKKVIYNAIFDEITVEELKNIPLIDSDSLVTITRREIRYITNIHINAPSRIIENERNKVYLLFDCILKGHIYKNKEFIVYITDKVKFDLKKLLYCKEPTYYENDFELIKTRIKLFHKFIQPLLTDKQKREFIGEFKSYNQYCDFAYVLKIDETFACLYHYFLIKSNINNITSFKFYENFSYNERNIAKERGYKWDSAAKKWFFEMIKIKVRTCSTCGRDGDESYIDEDNECGCRFNRKNECDDF